MESWLDDVKTACDPKESSRRTIRNIESVRRTSEYINKLLLDFRQDLIENPAQVIEELCNRFSNQLFILLTDATRVSIVELTEPISH